MDPSRDLRARRFRIRRPPNAGRRRNDRQHHGHRDANRNGIAGRRSESDRHQSVASRKRPNGRRRPVRVRLSGSGRIHRNRRKERLRGFRATGRCGFRRHAANALAAVASGAQDDRERDVARRRRPRARRNDVGFVFDQRRTARTNQRAGRRRQPQQRVLGRRQRPGRVRAREPVRLRTSHPRSRRRFRPGRI